MAKKAQQPTIKKVVSPIPGTIYFAAVATIVEGKLLNMTIRTKEGANDEEEYNCFLDPEIAYAFGEWLKPILEEYPNSDISTCGFDGDGDPLVKEIRLRP